jgi:hypothetical protein
MMLSYNDYGRLIRYCDARLELNEWTVARLNRLLKDLQMTNEKVAEWRRKCQDLTITREEYAEAIAYLREGRWSAVKPEKPKKEKKPKKASKPPMTQVDIEDLISQIESL